MLILSRKQNEEVVIDTGKELILISVADIKNHAVRMGFIAPKHIRIDRREIYDKRTEGLITTSAEALQLLDRD